MFFLRRSILATAINATLGRERHAVENPMAVEVMRDPYAAVDVHRVIVPANQSVAVEMEGDDAFNRVIGPTWRRRRRKAGSSNAG
jgi:hypothetical protein